MSTNSPRIPAKLHVSGTVEIQIEYPTGTVAGFLPSGVAGGSAQTLREYLLSTYSDDFPNVESLTRIAAIEIPKKVVGVTSNLPSSSSDRPAIYYSSATNGPWTEIPAGESYLPVGKGLLDKYLYSLDTGEVNQVVIIHMVS